MKYSIFLSLAAFIFLCIACSPSPRKHSPLLLKLEVPERKYVFEVLLMKPALSDDDYVVALKRPWHFKKIIARYNAYSTPPPKEIVYDADCDLVVITFQYDRQDSEVLRDTLELH